MSEPQRYHVLDRIAAGGMAEVYRGESAGIEGFRKKVAIKRVLPKLSENKEFINMFLDEARLCAYLNHSKCVQVFDIGQGAGSHFIVMEFVDGADLKGILEHLSAQERLLPVEVCCRIAMDICEGLSYAHQATDHAGKPLDIVHRDISPHNVLMTRHGEVKLVDFGLAKASSHLTDEEEDIVKGKFGYLAPEITLGKGADKRVDIFAAGILLWEMLSGKRLFKGANDLETFKLVRNAEVPDLRPLRGDVTDDVMRVLFKALARDPDQRYQTADSFARDLSIVLLRLGRPVSYQDLGKFVTEAADARARKKKAEHKVDAAMMGDLIIDTLHEFSAGDFDEIIAEVGSSRLGTRGVESGPSDEAFIDPTAWGLDDVLGSIAPRAPEPRAPEPRQAPPKPVAARPPGMAAPPPKPASAPQAAPPPKPVTSAAERARAKSVPPPDKEKSSGPFWRRLFGG
jgi:serine/threonine-protein kinase